MKSLLAIAAVLALGACGGQSAHEKMLAGCHSYGQRWAANYVKPMPDLPSQTVAQLAQSATQACIAGAGR